MASALSYLLLVAYLLYSAIFTPNRFAFLYFTIENGKLLIHLMSVIFPETSVSHLKVGLKEPLSDVI